MTKISMIIKTIKGIAGGEYLLPKLEIKEIEDVEADENTSPKIHEWLRDDEMVDGEGNEVTI